ncbi:hypothetical protein GCM10010358_64990 [Streptomyces minutiscleroticus]|uniref:Uncharacterized protein n=1 Tax=Streptomyces minutiscleroticus TaxID=68238 RepID=A0A918U6V8_9ACTN|nr:hypothetical protein GCM10010358_64990 [Streptomyces minutiscleroticus]
MTVEQAGGAGNVRRWRVVSTAGRGRDGRPRPYEIVPGPSAKYPGRSFAKHGICFTEYGKCEQFARDDPRTCGSGTGRSVDGRVDGRTPVHHATWTDAGSRRVARDEDRRPVPVRRRGFPGLPRGATAPDPPAPRRPAGRNGRPEGGGWETTCPSGCIVRRSRSTLP